MNERIDMKISGSSTMPGGEYKQVSISGAGKIKGNLRCASLHCSGAAKIQGDVDCTGEIRSSGAGKVEGSAQCESLSSSGAFSVGAGLTVRTLASGSGSLQITGQLTADEIRSTGSLDAGCVHCRAFSNSGFCKVSGDLEAESAVLTGATEIGGLLNAETVEISANRAVHIRAIGGSSIRILRKDASAFFGLFRAGSGCARVGSIEGDEIELEAVEAEIVRGRNVHIGEGCRIGCVEYSGTLTAAPGTVGKSVRTSAE